MKTLEQLLDIANQGKLDEIDMLAGLAQGWTCSNDGRNQEWVGKNGNVVATDYHPTRDKGQAVDLMLKAELSPVIFDGQIYFVGIRELPAMPKEEFTKTITIAFILAMQGDNDGC